MELSLRAYAKINLTLDVLHRRSDGYHELDTLFASVSLHDDLSLSLGGHDLSIECDAPLPRRNTVRTAALLYFEALGRPPSLRVRIRKRIPEMAGLGGGSADGAAVLRGLFRLLGGVSEPALFRLARKIGADVPYCLLGGYCRGRGRGDELTRVAGALPNAAVLIVKPAAGISTAALFQALRPPLLRPDTQGALGALARGDARALGAHLSNALEAPAIQALPQIGEIKNALLASGAFGATMTGSGSALIGLFESDASARAAAARFSGLFVQVCTLLEQIDCES